MRLIHSGPLLKKITILSPIVHLKPNNQPKLLNTVNKYERPVILTISGGNYRKLANVKSLDSLILLFLLFFVANVTIDSPKSMGKHRSF